MLGLVILAVVGAAISYRKLFSVGHTGDVLIKHLLGLRKALRKTT